MAQSCGLAGPATLRRVDQIAARIHDRLPEAHDQVAAMPAGPGSLLGVFTDAIAERTRLGQANAVRSDDADEDPAG